MMLVSRCPIEASPYAAPVMNAHLAEVSPTETGAGCLAASSSYSLSPLESLSTVTLSPAARTPRRSASTSAVSIVIAEAKSTTSTSSSSSDERRQARRSVTLPRIDVHDQRLGSPLAMALSKSAVNLDHRLSWLRRAQTAHRGRNGSLDETPFEDDAETVAASKVGSSPSAGNSKWSGWWSYEGTLERDDTFDEESLSIPDSPEPTSPSSSSSSSVSRQVERDQQLPPCHGHTQQSIPPCRKPRRSRLQSDPGRNQSPPHKSEPPRERHSSDPQSPGVCTAKSLAHPLARAMSRASSDLSTHEQPDSSRGGVTLPEVNQRPRSSSIGAHSVRPHPSMARVMEQQRGVYTPPPLRTKALQSQSKPANMEPSLMTRRNSDSSRPRRSPDRAAPSATPSALKTSHPTGSITSPASTNKVILKSRHRLMDRKTM